MLKSQLTRKAYFGRGRYFHYNFTISDYGQASYNVPLLIVAKLDSTVRLIMSDLDKIYYHGTETRRAYAIMTQGFKLGEKVHGRLLGRGLYITQQLNSAKFWSHFIVIKCQLLPGTRILWLHEGYDKKVLAYLKREFGKELLTLGPQFHRAIPKNKQLTGRELVTLCNYIFETRREKKWQYLFKARKGKKAQYYGDAWHDLARLHDQVKRHGFDALGDRSFEHWDSDEILVFNPSRIRPVSAHWLYNDDDFESVTISAAIALPELKKISARAQLEYEEEENEFQELEDESDNGMD